RGNAGHTACARRERGHSGCAIGQRRTGGLRPPDDQRRRSQEAAPCRPRQGVPVTTAGLRLDAAARQAMTGLVSADPFTTFIGSLAFWIAAVVSVTAAVLMVFQIKNLVRAALALTVVLGAAALLYALLGADFLAIAQLVVYAGAIMVLI